MMNCKLIVLYTLAVAACLLQVNAQQAPNNAPAAAVGRPAPVVGPVQSDKFRTTYVRLGSFSDEGLLYEPVLPGPNARIALVYSHPSANTFNETPGPEMAKRGYRILMVNHHGEQDDIEPFAPAISRGISYLRSLPGVQKVVIMGHSGGGHLMAFYENAAEHGPAACQGPEKIYPCSGEALRGLAKPDGIVLLDSTLGAFHPMSAVDPAVDDNNKRDAALDMFTPANGYDLEHKRAKYSAEFAQRFYAAQGARNSRLIETALARLNAIKQGKGQYADDEPFVVPGNGVNATGARLYHADTSFASHTKAAHRLLKADGSETEAIVPSVRPPSALGAVAALGSLELMSQNTTVRHFLAHSAVRTKPDYAITADDIVGVDWATSATSTPSNAEGITVPALVMPMTCHYLLVPNEIVFNHLASKDKTFAAVEGAVHTFSPCRPEYGDTVKRAFDQVDAWLSKPGRF
jgi:hypothetical protein